MYCQYQYEQLGREKPVEKNEELGRKWLLEAAKNGSLTAQNSLAIFYSHGACGFEASTTEAMHWWKEAAESGHPFALSQLANEYFYGHTTPKNYKEASRLYLEAAAYAPGLSLINLGEMYRDGLGVPQDYAEAYYWFSLAVPDALTKWNARESGRIAALRDAVAQELSAGELAEVQERASRWEPKKMPELR